MVNIIDTLLILKYFSLNCILENQLAIAQVNEMNWSEVLTLQHIAIINENSRYYIFKAIHEVQSNHQNIQPVLLKFLATTRHNDAEKI